MRLLCLFIFFCLCGHVLAQDLSSFSSRKLFDRSATLSMAYNGVASSRDTLVNQADAALISLNGSLDVLGFTVPIRFTYRQGQFNAATNNPFVRLGLSPSYKWIKIHLGHRQMHFSRYSLSNLTFLGAGVEINPGILRLAAMYGRLQVPNYNLDTLAFQADLVSEYKRFAHGIKAGFGKEKNYFDLFYLKSRDHYEVADTSLFYITRLPPPENLVLGADSRFTVLKKLNVAFNINVSVLTSNQAKDENSLQGDDIRNVRKVLGPFITINATTRTNMAGEASLQWQDRYFNIGVQYQRVDPLYQSFGIHYLLDDLENITLNGGVRLYKSRLTFNGSFGLQHNNLKAIRKNTSQRIICQLNGNVVLGTHAGMFLTYSNFSVDQKAGLVILNDTFRWVQTSSMINIAPFYRWGPKEVQYQVQLNYNQNQVQDFSPLTTEHLLGKIRSQMIQFRSDRRRQNWNWSVSLQHTIQDFQDITHKRLGGTIQTGKRWVKADLQLSGQVGYHVLRQNGQDDGHTIRTQLNASVRLQKRLSMNLLLAYFNKASIQSVRYDEFRFSTGIQYELLQRKTNSR